MKHYIQAYLIKTNIIVSCVRLKGNQDKVPPFVAKEKKKDQEDDYLTYKTLLCEDHYTKLKRLNLKWILKVVSRECGRKEFVFIKVEGEE